MQGSAKRDASSIATGHSQFCQIKMFSNQTSRAMSEGSMREDTNSLGLTHTHEFGTRPKCLQIRALSTSGLNFEEED